MELGVYRQAKMDNASFEQEDRSKNVPVEMGVVDTTLHSSSTPTPINGNGVLSCSDACQSLHQQHQKQYQDRTAPSLPESPWNHLKTIFLVGTIIFLAIWILVYTLLSQFHVV